MWKSARAYAQDGATGAGEAAQGPNFMSTIMFMLVIFGVMWMFLIRPNQRRDKERRALLAALAKGDEVVTNGGICGTIVGISEKKVVLKVSDSPVTKMEFLRGAISQVLKRDTEDEDAKS